MSLYDKEYQTPDLFGQPYPELVAFFSALPKRGTVLDLGCGQGRDSLALAQLGYEVTGVDISQVGVDQMLEKASQLGVTITGEVADIYTYEFAQTYDIVLLDSMIHFGKKERAQELALLRRTADHAQMICICIKQGKAREQELRAFFDQQEAEWETLHDGYLEYVYEDPASDHRSKTTYLMLVVQKSDA